MSTLLDAVVVIDLLDGDPRGDAQAGIFADAVVCSVNWLEVLGWAWRRRGLVARDWVPAVLATGLGVVAFTAQDAAHGPAVRAAEDVVRDGRPASLWRGLSTADVACLATALERGLPVATSDAVMTDVARHLRLDATTHRA